MPKRITYLQRRADLSTRAFREHWSTVHARIARDLPGVVAYRQNHVLAGAAPPTGGSRFRVDGIVELWFEDDDAASAGYGSATADRLAADERLFLSGLTGGPTESDGWHEPWPAKVWALIDADLDPERVAAAVAALAGEVPAVLGASTDILTRGARALVRDGLQQAEPLPRIAAAWGFADAATARAAHPRIAIGLEAGLTARGLAPAAVTSLLADELVIV